MKILIVDDDPDARRLLAVNLSWAGHEVVEAGSGEAAWAHFQAEPARLVITDWMMPGMNGIDLIRHIRAGQEQSGYSYIIVLTALSGKQQMVRGLDSGADDYLTKPFDPDELVARVKIAERILQLQEKLETSRRQMEVLAMQDALTGLLSRRAIHDRALAELNRLTRGTSSMPLSVIMLDIDDFKSINDNYGHEAGDRVLQQVAELLGQQLRSYDGLGRWGGEEFLMLLPGTGLGEARAVAERIRAAMAQTAPGGKQGLAVTLTASLGVATIDAHDPEAERGGSEHWLDQLVRAADQAMYRAKRDGRNRVCYAGETDGLEQPAARQAGELMSLRPLLTLKTTVSRGAWISYLGLWALAAFLAARWVHLLLWPAVLAGLLSALIFFVSEWVHQFGHALAAWRVGQPMTGIHFFNLFSASQYPPGEPPLPRRTHMARALGGFWINVVIGLLLMPIALYLWPRGREILPDAVSLLAWLAGFGVFTNLFALGLFALVPLSIPGGGLNDGATLLYYWRQGRQRANQAPK